MEVVDVLLKYWPIWSTISGSIAGLVAWNISVDKRLSKMENICSMSRETTEKREASVDKAVETLFDLMNELIPLVHEIKGMLKGKKNG